METISIENGEHYKWGGQCDGWHLLKRDDVSIIQEEVPPGCSEVNHYHKISSQFFYLLEGAASMYIDGEKIIINQGCGLFVPSGTPHMLKNEAVAPIKFLVISFPKSHGDKYEV